MQKNKRFLLSVALGVLCLLFTAALVQSSPLSVQADATATFNALVSNGVNATNTALAATSAAVTVSTPTPSAEECLQEALKNEPDFEFLYDFEQAEIGTNASWNTSQGEYKPDELKVTPDVMHCGENSLEITTRLDATSKEDVYHHTEVIAYFDQAIPSSFDEPGTQDFNGKIISCFVYIPSDFPHGIHDVAELFIFVKDRHFANQQSERQAITEDDLGKWINLSLLVDGKNENGADDQFDPTIVNALGIAIDVPGSSDLVATVIFNIDDCILRTPTSATPTAP